MSVVRAVSITTTTTTTTIYSTTTTTTTTTTQVAFRVGLEEEARVGEGHRRGSRLHPGIDLPAPRRLLLLLLLLRGDLPARQQAL